jgi:predicted enzyme related to lactoylglutathione lyase
MSTRLTFAIKYVDDMDSAVAFHRDQLGLVLKFQSPQWTEFATGETTLALHEATADKPAGSVQLGFGVPDVDAFYREREAAGVTFTQPPEAMHGAKIGRFLDSEGAECSIGGG